MDATYLEIPRWIELLYTYDFSIVHRPGKSHGNADGLSRRPCDECKYCIRQEGKEETYLVHKVTLRSSQAGGAEPWVESWSEDELKQWQTQDPIVGKVYQWVSNGKKPSWMEMQPEGATLRVYWAAFGFLVIVDGLLYHVAVKDKEKSHPRLVAPEEVRNRIFGYLHSSRTGGHFGIKRVLAAMRRRFWWPGMKKNVTQWIQECDRCQRCSRRPGPKRAPLQQNPVGSPMERVAFDILSFPDRTEDGNTCILVIADYFTKWTEAFALPNHTAARVADALVTEVFLRFGTPRFLHSDQAPEFMSELMTELCNLLEIDRTRTCPYRPQSDGLVERFNRTLIDMLSKFCNEYRDDWDVHLPFVMCAYRSSVNESTGFSPNLLMMGREILLPVDLMFMNPDDVQFQCRTEYVEWVRRAMLDNFEIARAHLAVAANRQKKYYDQRTRRRRFRVGDWVLRFYPPNKIRSKLNPAYVGPFLIVSQPGEVTFSIQRDPKSTKLTVHVDHLKHYRMEPQLKSWIRANEDEGRDKEQVPDRPTTGDGGEVEDVAQDVVDLTGRPYGIGSVSAEDLSLGHDVDLVMPRRSKRARCLPKRFEDFEL